jgi:peptidoglycan/LPS O-acetylase OafA/YrhL
VTTTQDPRPLTDAPPAVADQPARPRPVERLALLDGLRLTAALMVALFHYTAINLDASWGAKPHAVVFPGLVTATTYGWLGVELFFMISGFVICMSCWGRTVPEFARSRIVRLFPAYWPAVLITFAVVTLWPIARTPITPNQLVVNLTMMNEPLKVPSADLSYWTLWAEARFYLLFAFLVWYGLTQRRVLWFGYAWLIGSVVAVAANEPLLTVLLQPAYAPYFVAGIACYLIHRFGPDIRLWGLVFLAWALSMNALVKRVAAESATLHHHLSLSVTMVIVTAFFAILVLVASGVVPRVRWRWLTTAGLLTYPFYLLHQHIGLTIIHALQDVRPRYLTLAFVITVMMAAAWLLHRSIERPLAQLLRRRLATLSR